LSGGKTGGRSKPTSRRGETTGRPVWQDLRPSEYTPHQGGIRYLDSGGQAAQGRSGGLTPKFHAALLCFAEAGAAKGGRRSRRRSDWGKGERGRWKSLQETFRDDGRGTSGSAIRILAGSPTGKKKPGTPTGIVRFEHGGLDAFGFSTATGTGCGLGVSGRKKSPLPNARDWGGPGREGLSSFGRLWVNPGGWSTGRSGNRVGLSLVLWNG